MPYFKSEFSLLLELTDRDGKDIGVPPVDWRASFSTGKYPHYVASCIGGKLRNCVIDGNHIRVLFNRHGLGPGRLHCEFTCILPDDRYPDGTQDVVKLSPLDVMLTAKPEDCPCNISAKIELPAYIRDFDRLENTYGMALDEIVARLEAVLGREPSQGAGVADNSRVIPKIALVAEGERLRVLGAEPYIAAGYRPMLFRYCKWSNRRTTDEYPRKEGNNLHAFFGGDRNWKIDAEGYLYLLDSRAHESRDIREWLSPVLCLRPGLNEEELCITHGRSLCVPLTSNAVFEWAFAFVKEKKYGEAFREQHCVSNIANFQIVMQYFPVQAETRFYFSTAQPHRRLRRRVLQ